MNKKVNKGTNLVAATKQLKFSIQKW
jgi:hypothetical protein